jgi:hypothetical protein
MRTKTLLLTAVLSVAAAASSMADVFSVNIVGYVNVVCPVGYSLISNPLNATNNSLASLLPSVPEDTTAFKFVGSGFVSASFVDGVWNYPPTGVITVAPGEGIFIKTTTRFTNTFVGEVILASTNPIPAGYSIRSSVLPQSGLLTSTLNYPAAEDDTVFKWNGAGYNSFSYVDGTWGPSQPSFNVGESFFVKKTASANWVRNFTP